MQYRIESQESDITFDTAWLVTQILKGADQEANK